MRVKAAGVREAQGLSNQKWRDFAGVENLPRALSSAEHHLWSSCGKESKKLAPADLRKLEWII